MSDSLLIFSRRTDATEAGVSRIRGDNTRIISVARAVTITASNMDRAQRANFCATLLSKPDFVAAAAGLMARSSGGGGGGLRVVGREVHSRNAFQIGNGDKKLLNAIESAQCAFEVAKCNFLLAGEE